MDIKEIIVEQKEIGKLVGLAKRAFTTAKTRTVKVVVDQIEDYENEYFAGDEELARLVKAKQVLDKQIKEQKKDLDSQILERINNALVTKRGYDAEELYDKREQALLELLKDAQSMLNSIHKPDTVFDSIDIKNMGERLGNMIKELEGDGE